MVNSYDVAVLSEKVAYLEAAIKNAGIELPVVTSSDNGKTLQVVNGAWAVGDLIPEVVNALDSTSETDALSAAQGKALNTKIGVVDDVKYLRGKINLTSGGTPTQIITAAVAEMVTDNMLTKFDIIVAAGGFHSFNGYIYAGKDYGAGIYTDTGGDLCFWKRVNNVDTVYNITKTS